VPLPVAGAPGMEVSPEKHANGNGTTSALPPGPASGASGCCATFPGPLACYAVAVWRLTVLRSGFLPTVGHPPAVACGSYVPYPPTENTAVHGQSGRNTTRAAVGGEFPTCPLSVVQRVPRSTIAHVSVSPPRIPDGRMSRVQLAAAAYPQRTFPTTPRVKPSPVYATEMPGYTSRSTP
jgi:hypothetical protein